jgi:hypothetical protein
MAGCGCGCGPTTCRCGTQVTSSSGKAFEGGFFRPTFFAGQLLAEDDLEALASYQLAKTRLHNRYLFGSGVVCGLDVTCTNVALPRSVIVGAGYALGCGDDIFVPCAVEVDVIELFRSLPPDLNCGDPCQKLPTTPSVSARTADATENSEKGSTTEGEPPEQDDAAPEVKVVLGIEYAEVPRDPAMTYSVECGMQPTCEPTRIAEGYQFALRPFVDPFKLLEPAKKRPGFRQFSEEERSHAWSEFCRKLNPPCPDGDDSFVALAIVTLKECVVTTVCPSIRRYVVTWPTVRHWVGGLGEFELALQWLCCAAGEKEWPRRYIDSYMRFSETTWDDVLEEQRKNFENAETPTDIAPAGGSVPPATAPPTPAPAGAAPAKVAPAKVAPAKAAPAKAAPAKAAPAKAARAAKAAPSSKKAAARSGGPSDGN